MILSREVDSANRRQVLTIQNLDCEASVETCWETGLTDPIPQNAVFTGEKPSPQFESSQEICLGEDEPLYNHLYQRSYDHSQAHFLPLADTDVALSGALNPHDRQWNGAAACAATDRKPLRRH